MYCSIFACRCGLNDVCIHACIVCCYCYAEPLCVYVLYGYQCVLAESVYRRTVCCVYVCVFVWTHGCVCVSGWCCVTGLLSAMCSCAAVARGLPDNPSSLCKCAVICAVPGGMHRAFKQGSPACKALITAAQRAIIV